MDYIADIRRQRRAGGFTLLEILLVIALISILAGIVIVAVNPGRQLAAARDAQRKVDVNTILNATYQYILDNNGTLPAALTNSRTEICPGLDPDNCVDMSVLTAAQRYIDHMPRDPSLGENGSHTGYYIEKNPNDRITVGADGELQALIEISR